MMLAISRNKDPKASAPYLSLLKLSHSPFSDHAGAEFFYTDPDRAQYLDMLQHLAQYSDELLLVSGGRGSGKSELLERFLERAEEHWRSCRLQGGERLEADQLFSRIAECFQLDLGAGDNLLQSLQQQLNALQEQHLPVLLVDDAQSLSDDALEMVVHLAALEGEHGKLIRVLLFAEPSLEQRLSGERFAAMPQPHRIELKGLDADHIAAYLHHRLKAAGYTGTALFTPGELKQLLRETDGLPGRLNQEAHTLLLGRYSQQKAAGGGRRYLQMGLAASAVIGTVLGLHDRINALIGGEPQVMTVTAPERPVVRLAEEGNPWAVVIRNGESIQINCGAPGGATVGVRPMMTAAAQTEVDMPLTAPIMRDVSPVVNEPETEPEAEAESTPQPMAAPEPTPKQEAPTATESEEPMQVAANDAPEMPLVVKQADEPAAEESPEEAKPATLALDGVEPKPVSGSSEPRELFLTGSGFLPGSKVAVSRGGRVEVLPAEKVRHVDNGRLAITVTTGMEKSRWAVQVSTPDNRRSNVLRFDVEPPVEEKKPAEERVEAEAEKPAEPTKAEQKKPQSEPKVETTSSAAKPAVQPKASAGKETGTTPMKGTGVTKGYEWYAEQPKSNYTLQLLASEKRANAEAYAKAHKLAAPVGEFAMEHDDKTLYALTQGSYPSRAAAERAAAALPKGIKPWVRSMASVQQVMKRVKPAQRKVSSAPAADGERYKDTAWVWSQDPNHFTVQLSAASSEQAIEADMRRISLPGEMTVVQTLRDGKPWYALVYGSFPSKEAARGTIDRLPQPLKQAGPWPRSFASLQDEIRRSTP